MEKTCDHILWEYRWRKWLPTELKKPVIEKFAFTEPSRFWHFLHHLIPDNPFLVCALDIAAWDLYGKIQKKPLYACWKLNIGEGPLTDYTIGIDSIEKWLKKWCQTLAHKKIKMGTPEDVKHHPCLRRKNTLLRVDANSGWTLQEAWTWIPALHECGVEFIEQPLAKKTGRYAQYFEKSPYSFDRR